MNPSRFVVVLGDGESHLSESTCGVGSESRPDAAEARIVPFPVRDGRSEVAWARAVAAAGPDDVVVAVYDHSLVRVWPEPWLFVSTDGGGERHSVRV